jgi:hypothetical protein
MQGIKPHTLTNEELINYTTIQGFKNLSQEWIEELVIRLALLPDQPRTVKDTQTKELFDN